MMMKEVKVESHRRRMAPRARETNDSSTSSTLLAAASKNSPSKQLRTPSSLPDRRRRICWLPSLLIGMVVAVGPAWTVLFKSSGVVSDFSFDGSSADRPAASRDSNSTDATYHSPTPDDNPYTFVPTTNNSSLGTGDAKTLALLYPPGLLGGYRNQVLRFISFVVYAKKRGIEQLLLPSLLWSTQLNGIGYGVAWNPIPMEWVFDIQHWNDPAYHEHLPLLVTEVVDSDCWTSSPGSVPLNYSLSSPSVNSNLSATAIDSLNPLRLAALQSGSLLRISNYTHATMSGLRKTIRSEDLLDQVSHCQNPYVYGGGIRAGRLWNDYVRFTKRATKKSSGVPMQTDQWILRALRPAPQWRQVAEQCVRAATTTTTTIGGNHYYVALHARVELEIMNHACGKTMEWNLTRIVQQVQAHLQSMMQSSNVERTAAAPAPSGLFIAVSRAGMGVENFHYEKFKAIADDNLDTLNRLVGNSNSPGTGLPVDNDSDRTYIPVFECGERILEQYYALHPDVPDHGSLLQSVINFDVAVNADVFVGVKGSSYSSHVMTARYYLGKGDQNYRYTKGGGGIESVENGGLPEPHTNCQRPKKRKRQMGMTSTYKNGR